MQKGFTLDERDFFKEPFTRDDIKEILGNNPASDMFNFKSPSFKKLDLTAGDLSDEELINLMLEEPRLVRRPVIIIAGKTYFGASRKVLEAELNL